MDPKTTEALVDLLNNEPVVGLPTENTEEKADDMAAEETEEN